MRRAKKKKKIKGQRAKTPTPTQVIYALIGDEEQSNGKQKKEKETNKEQDPNQSTLDHSVTSYDPQGSYGEPIPLTPMSSASRSKYNSTTTKGQEPFKRMDRSLRKRRNLSTWNEPFQRV